MKIRKQLSSSLLWLSCLVIFTVEAYAETSIKSMPMEVSAVIKSGCVLNDHRENGVNLGTIEFGSFVLNQPLYVVSAENAGSIMLRCTPGTVATISLGAGSYTGDIITGRKLKQEGGSATLLYQLYQDAGYTQVWGDAEGKKENPMTIIATGSQVVFPVYAKLLPISTFPPAGKYRDTVTVTVAY